MAFSFTASSVGAMMNSDRNRLIPISTWLGGDCCRPSAWRRIASTTMIRVKLVIISSSAGRMVSRPITSSSWSDRLSGSPPAPAISPKARSSAPDTAASPVCARTSAG